ncbi:MAG: N-acetylmuramoyl-L-alanine amidase [Nitrospirae bacterium]|nr:N-acetylmuramoyl-L-alanine amidase [Nitrospirota bacterium]
MLFTRLRKGRHTILKAVYEDNLRIVGKNPTVSWKMPIFLRGHFLFLYIMILVVIGNADFLNSTFYFSNETQTISVSPIKNSEPHSSAEERVIPSEYLSMLEKKEIPVKQMFGLGVKTIVIDPGHGGSDPGTRGGLGIMEKDIALDIALKLKARLELHGDFNILLTRNRDETIPLTKRIEIANSNMADLFISIHVNYLPSKPINMIETYYFGPSADDETLQLAAKENADSHYRLSEFKEVIEKIGDTLKQEESRKFASFIQDSLYFNIRGQGSRVFNYGIKRAPFMVLLGIEMPGVLTEVSCLSNKQEELKLHTDNYRNDIARYLEYGILNYMKKGETTYEAKRGNRQ